MVIAMHIYLEDLVCYIDSYSSAFFNPTTYKFYYKNELSPNVCSSDMLQVPKVEELTIIYEFIKKYPALHNKPIYRMRDISIDRFYKEIHKYGLYDAWIDFRFDFLNNFASNWCYLNNIKFTNKHSR